MRQFLSFAATLLLFGLVFTLLHLLILWLDLSDLPALMVFALPITAYIAYCTQPDQAAMLRSAIAIYLSFALVVTFAGLLAVLIG